MEVVGLRVALQALGEEEEEEEVKKEWSGGGGAESAAHITELMDPHQARRDGEGVAGGFPQGPPIGRATFLQRAQRDHTGAARKLAHPQTLHLRRLKLKLLLLQVVAWMFKLSKEVLLHQVLQPPQWRAY